jgi:two-component system nitrogen regulation response regulator NtrX
MNKAHSILIVEDDLDIKNLMVELLEDEGYLCSSAADGMAGKKALESQHFDLLITDFRMPKLDGLQLLEWCRASQVKSKVIFISANARLTPAEKLALEESSASVIFKPISIDNLLSVVEASLKS